VAIELQPLHQFTIERLIPLHIGRLDVSFTNSALFMTISVVLITALMVLGTRKAALVPGRWQSVAEMMYEFVADMVDTNAGHGAREFFPFVFTLFLFILFTNLIGLVPYSFTVTSHIIVTFALAIFVFLMVIVVGLARHGLHFLGIFAPKVPWPMLILLIPIEVISFLSRPISLSVRLFANMLAGHTMLYVFGTFVIGLAAAGGALSVLSIAPLLAIIAVTALEFLIAFLQAYVFAILTCIYLNDALNLHEH
jgi:F-type H+-transporting ATPase subunit a